ncbi:MAG: xanthine dehydrogenase family protein subunit M [Clostridia bacterium]
MNTKILEREFDYLKPASLDEAKAILSQKKNVKIFAGGTDLIVKLKVGASIDMDNMMDINAIDELKKITDCTECRGVKIGAAAKLTVIENDTRVTERFQALAEAIHKMASVSVRNMGTLGGNFCNASPVADAVGPCMCYNAKVVLDSVRGERKVDAVDFFVAPGVTVMEQDEILTQICLPSPEKNTGAAFIKLGRVASDIAKISITCVIERDGNKIKVCRMAMGSVAARPLFLKNIADLLAGKQVTSALIADTADKISEFIKPIDDNRTTAQYRTDVAKVIARDCIELAWKRSGGEVK